MSIFWEHLFKYPFLQYAVFAAILASIACGIIGSFVVVKRITYVAGAIAHCVLGGMGAARYLQRVHGIEWLTPIIGATAAAVLAALIIAAITHSGRQRQDTVLSAVWAIGMALGISFITATPGYYEDLMSYLFGNILMVGKTELYHMLALDLIIAGIVFFFYNKFLAISFQPQLAKLRGINVGFYNTTLLVLISLTVVLLTQIVGLVMVIALLTLPAACASQIARSLCRMVVLSILLSLFFTIGGLVISYQPELPAGATVIEIAGVFYIIVLATKYLGGKFRRINHKKYQ